MRGNLIVSAVATMLVPITPTADSGRAALAARKILQECGADEAQLASAPDSAWLPIASSAARHAALRRSLGEPVATGRWMISIHGIGGHLATEEFSIILVRGADGVWKGTAVGQSTIWVSGASPSIMPRKDWSLPGSVGHRIDAILSDKCYYAEPVNYQQDGPPSLEAMGIDLETVASGRVRRSSYLAGEARGLTRQLADLSFPS